MPSFKQFKDGLFKSIGDMVKMDQQQTGSANGPPLLVDHGAALPPRPVGLSAQAVAASQHDTSNQPAHSTLVVETQKHEPIKGNRHVLAFKSARKSTKTNNTTTPSYLLPGGGKSVPVAGKQ